MHETGTVPGTGSFPGSREAYGVKSLEPVEGSGSHGGEPINIPEMEEISNIPGAIDGSSAPLHKHNGEGHFHMWQVFMVGGAAIGIGILAGYFLFKSTRISP